MKHRSELYDAVESENEEKILALLRDAADINQANRYGWTPLMAASLHGQVDMARLLLNHGADLHAANGEGRSAIHYAAIRNADAVHLLMRYGANVNMADGSGYQPLHLAAAHCNRKLVQKVCSALLAAGADVNAQNKWGTTPLWSAAFSGSGELVDFLLRHGADLKTRDHEGRTILMFVVKMGFFEDMAGQLLRCGADPNARDHENRTALMYAARSAWTVVIDILLDSGADINLQDARGMTALMYAAGESLKASSIGMLGREASTTPAGGNAPDWDPAKKAARLAKAYHARAEGVRRLLERGAVPDQRDATGRTARDIALENARVVAGDNEEVVQLLEHDPGPQSRKQGDIHLGTTR